MNPPKSDQERADQTLNKGFRQVFTAFLGGYPTIGVDDVDIPEVSEESCRKSP